MSMVIGRRHIILAALVVALAAAIFINYKFMQPNMTASVKSGTSSIGDAAYVDNQSVSSSDFFASARLTRTQNRDSAEEMYKTITANSSATTAQKNQATQNINQIAKDITTEGQIETLVEAKGFPECVCLIDNGTAEVIVKPKTESSLSANDIAQIYDIAINKTNFSKKAIQIIPQN